jgi:GNAT superfamily N-acetyltransferase
MVTKIEVRTVASVQELIAAQALLARTFPDHPAALDGDRAVAYRARFPDQADLMAIAVDSGADVVGAALASRSGGLGRAVLDALAVHPGAQGRGVATRLIALIEHAAKRRGASGLTLGSADDAVGFYLRMGYRAALLVQFVAAGASAEAEHAVAAALAGPLASYECLRRSYNGVPQFFVQVETVDMDLMRRVEREGPGVSAGWVLGKDF